MNTNFIDTTWILLGIDAALVVAVTVIWFLVNFRRGERARAAEEIRELRKSMETLGSELALLKVEAAQARQMPPARASAAPGVLNTDRRAEALEMLRQGNDAGAVSATLRLSQAEATLLEKVQGMLAPASYRR